MFPNSPLGPRRASSTAFCHQCRCTSSGLSVCVCMYVCWFVLARYHFKISVSLPTFSDYIFCDFFSLAEFRDISLPIGHDSLHHSHHPLHSMTLSSVDDTQTHTHARARAGWKSRRRSQECDSLLKRNNKCCTTCLLKRLVFEMQVPVKGCNISDHQTKGTSAPSYTYSVWRGRSETSDMDPVNCQEVLRCPSVGLFAILVWYSSELRGCRFIAAIVTYIGRCPSSPWVTGSCSALLTSTLPRSSLTPNRLNDNQENVTCISVHHYRLNH